MHRLKKLLFIIVLKRRVKSMVHTNLLLWMVFQIKATCEKWSQVNPSQATYYLLESKRQQQDWYVLFDIIVKIIPNCH